MRGKQGVNLDKKSALSYGDDEKSAAKAYDDALEPLGVPAVDCMPPSSACPLG